MRYFFIACFFSHLFVFNWYQNFQSRNPASYPNFVGSTANPAQPSSLVAPEPRKLGPPLNANSVTSMKDIEDSYGDGFLPQEMALKKEVDASSFRLSQLMNLRRSSGNSYNAADSGSELRKAIRQEQERLAYLQSLRAANSRYAFYDIELKYMATQIGLKPESHRRVNDLLNYVLHIYFEASSSSYNTTYASYSTPFSSSLTTMPESYPGVILPNTKTSEEILNSDTQQDTENFIGPMPEEKPTTTAI